MPQIEFHSQMVEISDDGYAALAASSDVVAQGLLSAEDVVLNILYAEGLLCAICEERLATRDAIYHAHTRLCAVCAEDEPHEEPEKNPIAPAFCYVGSHGPRDWHTGEPLLDYEGLIVFFHNGDATLMHTEVIDGERHYGIKAFFPQES